ncbi:hypothetical protein C4D60_Mb06t19100 [Musa balbisiana]|uniref:Transposase (putative) gypsy type domain-containing protein n=1 Tax=Musa balbisiana TaxID=52838 RepID=A0A4S8IRL8_MUSBA|nr:hypothetical protein C4D60_Mb06t19100 [Musa balbisiana]
MASPSFVTSPSSPLHSSKVGEKTLSPSPDSSSDEKAARALEALMWSHDLDSTVSESLLGNLRECYCISKDYVLLALEPGQWAYDPIPKGFALTLDALEVGLHFPLHPVISSCISWWHISPSQMAPNSWRYLVAFLGECHYVGITPTRSLFLSCFRLSKGSRGLGFRLQWSARMIDNTAPALNDDEYKDLRRLNEILPSSRAIRNMTERWLIEAGLSPMPRGMVNLKSMRGGRASSVSSLHPQAEPRIGSKEAPVEVEAGRPRKKTKTCVAKAPGEVVAHPGGAATESTDRLRRSLERGEAGPNRERARKALREPSIHELCHLPAGTKDEPYLVRVMGDLPEGEASDPLVARWGGLSREERVWADGNSEALFIRGGLHPDMARELYTLSSKVLLGKSTKSLLWHYAMALMDRVRDTGRVIGHLSDRNVELRREIEEIHAGTAPEAVAAAEQHVSDLEAEVTRLRSELKATEEQNKGL